jgi:hypothetical protein
MTKNTQKWINALRSGKYKKTTHHLSHNGKFCCLGVACEVAIANGVKLKVRDTKRFGQSRTYNGLRNFPPLSVIKWLGFKKGKKVREFEQALATLNDYKGKSFKAIADVIAEASEELFA